MTDIIQKIAGLDWEMIGKEMDRTGFAIARQLLAEEECKLFVRSYHDQWLYRKTISMERFRFGLGEYKYFHYPLPEIIEIIRREVYSRLVPIANSWMYNLQVNEQYPQTFEEFQKLCHTNNQTKPTVLILKYGKGGHNTLHQDLYGNLFFPIQAVLFLSEPVKDYTGGEFVLTQQVPRAQSKALVIRPNQGDLLLFTTNFRPVKGTKGYYRVIMKHGVSEVHEGERHTLGIIFHDAEN